jgi:phytoene dehydrogenase-like protein
MMPKKYENIIIGAGIGGMVIGGYLAKAGQTTLILEKKKKVGGKFKVTHFTEDAFGQDQGPVMWTWQNGGFLGTATRDLGVNFKNFLYPQQASYRLGSHQPPTILPICSTAEALTDFTMSHLPTEGLLPDTEAEFLKVYKTILDASAEEMLRLEKVVYGDWITTLTSNPVVINYFARFIASFHMCEVDVAMRFINAQTVLVFIRYWQAGEAFLTVIYPDPITGLIQPIEKAIKGLGCEIRTEIKVTEVLIENHRTIGVKVRNASGEEEEIHADRVIVNADFTDIPKIFKELPSDLVQPIENMKKVDLMDFYCFTLLKGNPNMLPNIVNIIDEQGNNLGGISPQSLYMPWSVPEGKHLTILVRVYPRKVGEKLTKEQVLKEITDIQEDCYPGFRDLIEYQDCIHHYPLWHHPTIGLEKINQKSSTIENLYFVGDSTSPLLGCGVDGTLSTAVFLAERLLGKKIKKLI